MLKFCKKYSRSGHSISTCPDERCAKQLNKPYFQKHTFNQAKKGNQNLPNKQITSNNMTGKPLPFPYRSRRNIRDVRDISRHKSPNTSSFTNSKPYYGNKNFRPPSKSGSPYPRRPNSQKKPNYNNNNNNYSINPRPQSPNYKRDSNRSRQLFSRNSIRNVRNYINSLLDQEQTDDTTSNTEHMETQCVSEEQLLQQQFNDNFRIRSRYKRRKL